MGFACKSEANFSQYCNLEVERLLDQQSQEPDTAKRKALVWRIERILVEDVARPIILHNHAATCWHSHFKGHVHMKIRFTTTGASTTFGSTNSGRTRRVGRVHLREPA